MAMKKSAYENFSADKSKDKSVSGTGKREGSPAEERMDRTAIKKLNKKK